MLETNWAEKKNSKLDGHAIPDRKSGSGLKHDSYERYFSKISDACNMNINSYEKIDQSSEALRMKGAQKPENSTNYRASITSNLWTHSDFFHTVSKKIHLYKTSHHICATA